jgi:hypothetical protein
MPAMRTAHGGSLPRWTIHTVVTEVCQEKADTNGADLEIMDSDARAKALRLYLSCSECARLIDLAEGRRPARYVDRADLARHFAEEHEVWLDEVLGVLES